MNYRNTDLQKQIYIGITDRKMLVLLPLHRSQNLLFGRPKSDLKIVFAAVAISNIFTYSFFLKSIMQFLLIIYYGSTKNITFAHTKAAYEMTVRGHEVEFLPRLESLEDTSHQNYKYYTYIFCVTIMNCINKNEVE